MCLAQGPQCSDAGEARTRNPLVWSQALYHWATALPIGNLEFKDTKEPFLLEHMALFFGFKMRSYYILLSYLCLMTWRLNVYPDQISVNTIAKAFKL